MIQFATIALAYASLNTVSALTSNNPSLILTNSATANVSSSNYIHQCDGAAYGRDLNSTSCANALDQIDSSSTIEMTYGQRYTGLFDVKLPQRYISCTFSPSY